MREVANKGFRADAEMQARLTSLAQQTGLTESEVIRQLITNAELKPVSVLRPVGKLPVVQSSEMHNGGALSSQAERSTVVA